MSYSAWSKGKDLRVWADTLEARQKLPALVRRLIHATVENPKLVQFPADEGIQRRGWDGVWRRSVVTLGFQRAKVFGRWELIKTLCRKPKAITQDELRIPGLSVRERPLLFLLLHGNGKGKRLGAMRSARKRSGWRSWFGIATTWNNGLKLRLVLTLGSLVYWESDRRVFAIFRIIGIVWRRRALRPSRPRFFSLAEQKPRRTCGRELRVPPPR